MNTQKILKSLMSLFTSKDLVILFLLVAVFFITRTINLEHFPIFSDEGIYIRWAKVAWHDASWRFISLTDGRQPLQTWATIPFLKIFPDRALVAGRLFGVFSGFFGLVGVYVLSLYLFGQKTAVASALLYIITPFYLFFDRLSMIDSFVSASYVWVIFLSILLVRYLRLDVALIFGFLGGFFLLAKSSVSMFLATSLLAPIVVWNNKHYKKKLWLLVDFLILFILTIGIAFLIYNVQRLSPFLHFVGEKNHTFVKTIDEVLSSPFSVLSYNIPYVPLHIAHNLGWATFLFGIVGMYTLYKKEKQLVWYFGLSLLFPYIVMIFFMKVLFSRYIIFMHVPFIIFAAYFLTHTRIFRFKKVSYLILVLLYLFTLYFDYTIMFDYRNIPFLKDDRGQYIEEWPSGYGIKEIMEYAREKSRVKPVIIIAEGNFGMTGDVLDVFLKRDDKISITPYWPLEAVHIKEHQKFLTTHYVYTVASYRFDPSDKPLKVITRFDKPGGKSPLYFFEVIP